MTLYTHWRIEKCIVYKMKDWWMILNAEWTFENSLNAERNPQNWNWIRNEEYGSHIKYTMKNWEGYSMHNEELRNDVEYTMTKWEMVLYTQWRTEKLYCVQ